MPKKIGGTKKTKKIEVKKKIVIRKPALKKVKIKKTLKTKVRLPKAKTVKAKVVKKNTTKLKTSKAKTSKADKPKRSKVQGNKKKLNSKTKVVNGKARITLEELFADFDAQILKQDPKNVTYAYSHYSAPLKGQKRPNVEELAKEGAEQVFEIEKEDYLTHTAVFHKVIMTVGIALFTVVVSSMWYHISKGYYEEINSNISVNEQLQNKIKEGAQILNNAKIELNSVVEQAKQESTDQNLENGVKAITEQLKNDLSK